MEKKIYKEANKFERLVYNIANLFYKLLTQTNVCDNISTDKSLL